MASLAILAASTIAEVDNSEPRRREVILCRMGLSIGFWVLAFALHITVSIYMAGMAESTTYS